MPSTTINQSSVGTYIGPLPPTSYNTPVWDQPTLDERFASVQQSQADLERRFRELVDLFRNHLHPTPESTPVMGVWRQTDELRYPGGSASA